MADLNSLTEALEYHDVPEHLRKCLLGWMLYGRIPGGFLKAVMRNDLQDAVARADHASSEGLVRLVRALWQGMPSGAWGSPAKVQAWQGHQGLAGRRGVEHRFD